MITEPIDYQKFFGHCDKAYQRYGSVFDLPIIKSPYAYLIESYRTYPAGLVLDFGCGVKKQLQKELRLPDEAYHTCDNDPTGQFTFARIDQIPPGQTYQIIAANQVFEHLDFNDAVAVAVSLADHVAPGGIFLVSTPNPQHPTRHLSNPTHRTPLNYLNLYALLALGELDPFCCARYNKTRGPRWYERPLVNMMCRVFRMDWCDSVCVVGRRNS